MGTLGARGNLVLAAMGHLSQRSVAPGLLRKQARLLKVLLGIALQGIERPNSMVSRQFTVAARSVLRRVPWQC